MVTYQSIGENAQFIELCGDMYGRAYLIIDIDKNKMFVEYAGQIVGELTEHLRMKWSKNTNVRVKNLVRENIRIIKGYFNK